MKEWSDTQWFTAGDLEVVVPSSTPVVNSGNTDEAANVWPESGTSSNSAEYTEGAETSATGGSGIVAPITIITDYWLRAETGEIITDESGASLSLESV